MQAKPTRASASASSPPTTTTKLEPAAPALIRHFEPGSAEWIAALPRVWRLGVVLGPTGAGKTTALTQLRAAGILSAGGEPSEAEWPADKAIVSAIAASPICRTAATTANDKHFGVAPSEEMCAQQAIAALSAVGLNSLPVWLRPFHALSNGQRARAGVARNLATGHALDDFGATVDARSACVCAAGIARSCRRAKMQNIVIASAHKSLLPYAQIVTSIASRRGARMAVGTLRIGKRAPTGRGAR